MNMNINAFFTRHLAITCLALMMTRPAHLMADDSQNQILIYAVTGTLRSTVAGTENQIILDGLQSKNKTGIVAQGPGKLTTGPNSSALIVLPAAGTVKLGPETEILLSVPKSELAEREVKHDLELLKGRLFLNIDPAEINKSRRTNFTLKTPAALLAVKGTQFFAQSDDNGDIAGVHEGKVQVLIQDEGYLTTASKYLSEGQAVSIQAGNISDARDFNPEERRWNANYKEAALVRDRAQGEWTDEAIAYTSKNFDAKNPYGTVFRITNGRNAKLSADLVLKNISPSARLLAVEMLISATHDETVTVNVPGLSETILLTASPTSFTRAPQKVILPLTRNTTAKTLNLHVERRPKPVPPVEVGKRPLPIAMNTVEITGICVLSRVK
jgi:FecR-like protein